MWVLFWKPLSLSHPDAELQFVWMIWSETGGAIKWWKVSTGPHIGTNVLFTSRTIKQCNYWLTQQMSPICRLFYIKSDQMKQSLVYNGGMRRAFCVSGTFADPSRCKKETSWTLKLGHKARNWEVFLESSSSSTLTASSNKPPCIPECLSPRNNVKTNWHKKDFRFGFSKQEFFVCFF